MSIGDTEGCAVNLKDSLRWKAQTADHKEAERAVALRVAKEVTEICTKAQKVIEEAEKAISQAGLCEEASKEVTSAMTALKGIPELGKDEAGVDLVQIILDQHLGEGTASIGDLRSRLGELQTRLAVHITTAPPKPKSTTRQAPVPTEKIFQNENPAPPKTAVAKEPSAAPAPAASQTDTTEAQKPAPPKTAVAKEPSAAPAPAASQTDNAEAQKPAAPPKTAVAKESAVASGPAASQTENTEAPKQPSQPLKEQGKQLMQQLDGVAITKYIAGGAQNTVQYTTWDFAGQKQFYGLFHVFLTRYCIYLVVFNMSDMVDETKREAALDFLQFWLEMVHLYARDGDNSRAPTVIVGTHKDKVPDRADHLKISNYILNRFESAQCFCDVIDDMCEGEPDGLPLCYFAIDNDNTKGEDPVLPRLRRQVDTSVREDPTDYVNARVPNEWCVICDELKKMSKEGRPTLTMTQMAEVAQKHDVYEDEMIKMLEMFHKLGIIIFYNEPLLRDLIVLTPQWLISKICYILRDWSRVDAGHSTKEDYLVRKKHANAWYNIKNGVLDVELLKIFWDESVDGVKMDHATREAILKLLDRFGVVCRGGGVNKYLVPACLPDVGTIDENKILETAEMYGMACFRDMFDEVSDDIEDRDRLRRLATVKTNAKPKQAWSFLNLSDGEQGPWAFRLDFRNKDGEMGDGFLPEGFFSRMVALGVESHLLVEENYQLDLPYRAKHDNDAQCFAVTRDTALLSFGSASNKCVFMMHQSRREHAVYVVLQKDADNTAPAEVLTRLQYITSEVNMASFRKQIVVDVKLCNKKGQEAKFIDVHRAIIKGQEKLRGNLCVDDYRIWFNTTPESVVCRKPDRNTLMDLMQNHYPKLIDGLTSEEVFARVDLNGDGEVTAEEITRWVIKDSIPYIDHSNTLPYEEQAQQEYKKPEMVSLKSDLLALFQAEKAALRAELDARQAEMEKTFVKKHAWERLTVHLQPHDSSNPIWQYACHVESCMTDAFAGFKAIQSGNIDPSTSFKVAASAKAVEGIGSVVPFASLFTAGLAAGIKFADAKQTQFNANLFTKSCPSATAFEFGARLAATRMAWAKHAQLAQLSTAEHNNGVSEDMLEAVMRSQSRFVPGVDNTEARKMAREDANRGLRPIILGENEDLDVDGLARVLYGAMGGYQLEFAKLADRIGSPRGPLLLSIHLQGCS